MIQDHRILIEIFDIEEFIMFMCAVFLTFIFTVIRFWRKYGKRIKLFIDIFFPPAMDDRKGEKLRNPYRLKESPEEPPAKLEDERPGWQSDRCESRLLKCIEWFNNLRAQIAGHDGELKRGEKHFRTLDRKMDKLQDTMNTKFDAMCGDISFIKGQLKGMAK